MPVTWNATGIKFDLNVSGARTTYQNTVAFGAHTNISPLSSSYPAGVNPAYPVYGSGGLNINDNYTKMAILQYNASVLIAGTTYYNTTGRPIWIQFIAGREDGVLNIHTEANTGTNQFQRTSRTGYFPFSSSGFSYTTAVVLIPAGRGWYYSASNTSTNYPNNNIHNRFKIIYSNGSYGSPIALSR